MSEKRAVREKHMGYLDALTLYILKNYYFILILKTFGKFPSPSHNIPPQKEEK